MSFLLFRFSAAGCIAATATATATAAAAAALPAEGVVVTATGVCDAPDEVACRLYSGPRTADDTGCIFRNLEPGTYALVVAILPKRQDDLARDFLGRPRQPWGVPNNIRHALRAPRYDEAASTLVRGKDMRLRIALAK